MNTYTDLPSDGPIRIDLKEVLKAKLGGKARLVPGFVVRKLERIICQDKLNRLLEVTYPATGADFCSGVLKDLDITLHISGQENLPQDGRCIFVSNHPLGGLDGMALIKVLTEHYKENVRFVVNDLLNAVRPLAPVFIPINKHGNQSRSSLRQLDDELAGNAPVIIFPAGLCSRADKSGHVEDLEWKKTFITKAIEFHRDIVPIYFDGKNSRFFYNLARRRKKFGIKFNIEMLYLPQEVFRASGSDFTITIGKPLSWQSLTGGRMASEEAARIKELVYNLSDNNKPNK